MRFKKACGDVFIIAKLDVIKSQNTSKAVNLGLNLVQIKVCYLERMSQIFVVLFGVKTF